jgi:hypothetical protein
MEDEGERKNGVYLGFSMRGANRIRWRRQLVQRGVRHLSAGGGVFCSVEVAVALRLGRCVRLAAAGPGRRFRLTRDARQDHGRVRSG